MSSEVENIILDHFDVFPAQDVSMTLAGSREQTEGERWFKKWFSFLLALIYDDFAFLSCDALPTPTAYARAFYTIFNLQFVFGPFSRSDIYVQIKPLREAIRTREV